mmetsp:Transcript_51553/g.136211  ORF Transcript_51553/g.136211 Transcript_51553/m.136211 type:complete len:265 (-) Transcript_51553:737-1531(-)
MLPLLRSSRVQYMRVMPVVTLKYKMSPSFVIQNSLSSHDSSCSRLLSWWSFQSFALKTGWCLSKYGSISYRRFLARCPSSKAASLMLCSVMLSSPPYPRSAGGTSSVFDSFSCGSILRILSKKWAPTRLDSAARVPGSIEKPAQNSSKHTTPSFLESSSSMRCSPSASSPHCLQAFWSSSSDREPSLSVSSSSKMSRACFVKWCFNRATARRCAPRWPISSLLTTRRGTCSSNGDTRPLSRYALMKLPSSSSQVANRFVTPPVM